MNTACVVGLTFKPSATGTRTATLTISDDAPGSPQTVPLTGISNTLLSVAPGPGASLSATITAGQTAAYDLQLTPGFTGMVSFSCSGAPTAATCTVPAALNVTSGTSAPVVVTVTTTGSSAIGPFLNGVRFIPFSAVRTLLVAMLFCLLVWAGLTLCGTASRADYGAPDVARRPHMARVAGLVAFATLTGCSFSGCGGGSSVAQSAPLTQPLVTPPGTSAITITLAATSSGGAQLSGIAPIQLSLTVN